MYVRVLQLHKRDSYEYKFIQDKYSINLNNKIISIADGTTQSYDSGFWAQLLCDRFKIEPEFQSKNLLKAFKEEAISVKNRKVQLSPNPAKAALEKDKLKKGSTSTFLGIRVEGNNTIKAISLGDSNLFILRENKLLNSYPFKDVTELNNNNDFVNTQNLLEDNVNPRLFKVETIQVLNEDIVILASDALSRFIFKYPEKLNDILKIESFDDLHEFITSQWGLGLLEEDDITAVIIELNQKNQLMVVSPPDNFSFPKEIEKEFIPNSLTKQNQSSKSIFSEMQMTEIRNQFNGVANDFHSVKKKLRIQRILLILITILLISNLALLYKWSEDESQNIENKAISEEELIDI